MKRVIAFLLFLVAVSIAVPLIAQDTSTMTPEEEKSAFLRFVQDRISTPDRQIRISNINGILSSTASIDQITIADSQGVYLRILNAAIDWNQAALLTGRLEVRSLTADKIEYLRNPVPPPPAEGAAALPAPEAQPLEIPQLPVAVILEKLSVPEVTFGEQVFGLGSKISVAGNLNLQGGSLDADLDIVRLDGPGGTLGAKVDYVSDTQNLDLDITLTEPPNGIIANLLQIEGRPDVALSVKGSGPVTALGAQLAFDAGGSRALGGTGTISKVAEGFAIDADLRGPIANLVAAPYRPFFGSETGLKANALIRDAGGISITDIDLSGGQLALKGKAEITEDGFLRVLSLGGTVADPAGNRVVLPLPGGATSVKDATIAVDYGTGAGENWSANATLNDFVTTGYAAQSFMLTASGVAANLDQPDQRRLTFNGDGMLTGIQTSDPAIQAALGDEIGLGFAGLWNAGEPVRLAQLLIKGKALSLGADGELDGPQFNGNVAVQTSSIAPFSGIAGRDLAGGLTLQAKGTISPLIGGFDLLLSGTGSDLRVDEPTVDGLLKGEVRLAGRVARTELGISAENFSVSNPQVAISANGSFASQTADFAFGVNLADLKLVSPQASGALRVTGTAQGTNGNIALNLDAGVAAGNLAGRPLRDAALRFAGNLSGETIAGDVTGSAFLDGHRVDLSAGLRQAGNERQLSDLRFTTGGATLTGDIAQGADGLLTGNVALDAADISTAAALLLQQAAGSVNATIALATNNGKQSADLSGRVSGLNVADIRVGAADFRASVADLFGVPIIDGTINGQRIAAAGVTVDTLAATASRTGDTTQFDGTAHLATGTDLALSGNLTPLSGGYRVALDRAELQQGQLQARLAQPTALAIENGNVSLDAVQFAVGGGRITANGSAGSTLDVTLRLDNLPLAIANAIKPDLGLAGTLNGTARISGSASAPQASFELAGSGIDANALNGIGIAPVTVAASGSFAGNTVRLAELRASGTGGLTVTGSGTVPLSGGGLAVSLRGTAPLALGNRFVADRGGQLSGTVTLDADITGSIAAPRFAGTVSTAGAGYIDPALNLRLQNISGSAALSGDRVTVNRLTADLATGGSLSASGSVSLTGAGLPADLRIALNQARYADGTLVVATLSGDLALRGPVLDGPILSGNVFVDRAEVTVPERLGGNGTAVDVDHVHTPRDVAATLAKARLDAAGRSRGGPSSDLQLDLTVNAPNQVFIRGGGVDAEVGGAVRLTGPVSAIEPVGALNLIRGRLSILGQRVTFETGSLTLTGDLDPFVDLTARAEGDDITVFVNVAGRVSQPEVTFSSNPPLPQDEVLARLIFKRSMGELSPLQLAKLAGAAAGLAGGGNGSLVDSLRDASGLADLDIVTDAGGNVAVQAGQYLQDNIYLGVQAGANGESRVSVDLDITEDLKARASVNAQGNSDIGVFYETDY